MIVWALFDSGNGCYTQVANKFPGIEIYPIGMDIERKNDHFINLNLADYTRIFGDNQLFDTLDKLPKPDLIIASPPCESWSNASAMRGGNACWKQEDLSDSLFTPQIEPSMFTIRSESDYKEAYINYKYSKQFMKRVNGELTIFNTIEIIKRYMPRVFIIENPASGRIWKYIEEIIEFKLPYLNLTRYNNYDYPLQKPTKFASNIYLELKTDIVKPEVTWQDFPSSYNERSNIPHKLIEHIFNKVMEHLETLERS
ncbi:DNA methyltransferase [Aerococcaceae bacterium NML190073]|nr:DNA methyltransferase [Aerococcaceae bacterium NML190073]